MAKTNSRLMKTRYRWGIVVAVIVVAGGGWMAFNRGPQPTEIQVATVGRSDLQSKVSANGKVQAQKKVDISATVAGQITHLAVKEGDVVKKGQLLLQIDQANPRAGARSAEASLAALEHDFESARASLEQARADFRRADGQHREGILAEADYDRARTALATAQQAFE